MKQHCRSLLIFAFLIGLSPALIRASQSPAASGTGSAPHSPIGTGLDSLVYWSTALPFLDVFKTSSDWMSGAADTWDDHRALDLDEHGWVRSLLPGQRAISLVMYGPSVWVGGVYRVPAGRYTVQYDGEGTLEYYGARLVQRDPGRDQIELQAQPNEGLALIITSVNPSNYLRNIRVMMPGAIPGETLNPRFLESLRGYATIRFLSWTAGPDNDSYGFTPHTWATRPTSNDARWSYNHGAPVEVMVDLCNRVHANPWFHIPHLADDDYVRQFAQTVRDSLDPGLKVYVEHSNEVWNSAYHYQYDYASQRGLALGLSTDPDEARQLYHALRTRQIGSIFREVLGHDRVVVVLGSFSSIASISETMLSWNGTAADVDALAIAPYFGYELGLKENEPRVAQMSLDDLFRDLQTNWIPQMNSDIQAQAAVAQKYGVPLISYEGGQHLVNLDGNQIEKVFTLFDAANHDPRMGQLYSKHLDDWNRMTRGGLWMHLMNCGGAAGGARWGAIEYLGQPRSEAPKYDAIQSWMTQASVSVSGSVDDLQGLSDEFNSSSTLSQWQRIYNVENWGANQLELLDINATRPGKLVMMPYTSTWYQDYRGELTFKTIQGDFVVTTDVVASQRNGTGAPRSLYSLGGIMVRAPRQVTPQTWTPGGENYVFLSIGSADQPGTFEYEVKTTTNSDSRLEVSPGTNHAVIQIARIGSYFITLTQAAGGTWRVHRRFRRTDMPQTLQAGMTVYTDYPDASKLSPFDHNRTVIHDGNPDLVAEFDYMRFQRPVLPTALVGKDLTDPAAVSDDQLLAFLGANSNIPPGIAFTFPDRGGLSVTTPGASQSVGVGYGRIQPNAGSGAPSGLAIFGYRPNGILVTEAGVAASPLVQSGRIYTEVAAPVNTGIAIANPNNQPATISYYFTDSNGQNFGQGTMTIDPNGQISKFLSDPPFSLTSATGTFTFNSSLPVSVIALRGLTNQRSEFLITTLPVADTTPPSASPIIFPHFTDGAGWTTQVVLINPTDNTLAGTAQFWNPGTPATPGSPINLMVNGQISSIFQYSIPPRSSYRLRTSGVGSSIQSGSVRITPSAGNSAPSGLVVFSYTNQAGITVSEAGVPALAADTAFRIYAEGSGITGQIGSIQTGVAIANPGAAPVTVNFDLTTLAGAPTGMTASVTVPGQGQMAEFLNQAFPSLGTFQGVLRISSNAAIAVTGLRVRYNERGDFLTTTTPPVNENTAAANPALIFPHFADGGGYTTQFVVFSAVPGQSASGTVLLSSQSGATLNLPVQ